MFDCHYDLLTQIYINRDNIGHIKEFCKEVYNKQNIIGGIFNLFFMSYEEMQQELLISREEMNVVKMLKQVDCIIKQQHLLSKGIKYIYGIEGLDYINIENIDDLYELGVRSVTIVWNNENKFGGGSRAKCGLTSLGKELIRKLVNKKIAIDLSHANEKTFYEIIEECIKLREERSTTTLLCFTFKFQKNM